MEVHARSDVRNTGTRSRECRARLLDSLGHRLKETQDLRKVRLKPATTTAVKRCRKPRETGAVPEFRQSTATGGGFRANGAIAAGHVACVISRPNASLERTTHVWNRRRVRNRDLWDALLRNQCPDPDLYRRT